MAMSSSTATGSRHPIDPTRWCAWSHRGHRLWASMPAAFWVYVYKVQLCPELKSRHEWRTCPYAHLGERARRRHPDRFPYLPVHCPDHRDPPPPEQHHAAPRRAAVASSCARGLDCQYAHGVFELWLHPSRFRTRMCDAGAGCRRRVCFFAHSGAELRVEDDPVPHVELPPPPPPRAMRARPAPPSLPRRAGLAMQARTGKVRQHGGHSGSSSSSSAPPAATVAVAATVAPAPAQPQASPDGHPKDDDGTAGKSGGDASEDGFVAGDYPYIDLIRDMI